MKYTVNTVHFTVLQYTLFAFFTFYVWALRVVLALPGTTLHQCPPNIILSILSITVYFIRIFYILCLSLKVVLALPGTTEAQTITKWSSNIKCKKLTLLLPCNTLHFTVLEHTSIAFFTFYVWAFRVVPALPGTTLKSVLTSGTTIQSMKSRQFFQRGHCL